MDVELTNCGFVQPFVPAVIMNLDMMTSAVPRNATYTYLTIPDDTPTQTIVLKTAPVNVKWVEVWLDGFRVFNPSLDFGATHTVFECFSNVIQFKTPITGNLKIICDGAFYYDMPDAYLVKPTTVQGASGVNTTPGTVVAGYFCEPIILTQPVYGFTRLSDDFQTLIYVPNNGFVGNDSFSYAVYTDRGQISQPKCVQITITDPTGTIKAAGTTTPTPPIDTSNTGA